MSVRTQLAGMIAVALAVGVGLAYAFHDASRPADATPTCSQATLGFAATFVLTGDSRTAVIGYTAPGPTGQPVVTCRLSDAAADGSSVRVTAADGTELLSSARSGGAPPGTIITQASRFSIEAPADRFCRAPQPLTVTAKGMGIEVTGSVRLSMAGGVCSLAS